MKRYEKTRWIKKLTVRKSSVFNDLREDDLREELLVTSRATAEKLSKRQSEMRDCVWICTYGA